MKDRDRMADAIMTWISFEKCGSAISLLWAAGQRTANLSNISHGQATHSAPWDLLCPLIRGSGGAKALCTYSNSNGKESRNQD